MLVFTKIKRINLHNFLNLYYSGAQKKWPLCKKNEPRNKKHSVKNFIFFIDKLNMIDFNIFKILKLIFTCESCAISITE